MSNERRRSAGWRQRRSGGWAIAVALLTSACLSSPSAGTPRAGALTTLTPDPTFASPSPEPTRHIEIPNVGLAIDLPMDWLVIGERADDELRQIAWPTRSAAQLMTDR